MKANAAFAGAARKIVLRAEAFVMGDGAVVFVDRNVNR